MTGYLTKLIDRQLRRVTVATVAGIAVVTTTALAVSRFHDPRFDEADQAVEKAYALIDAATCSGSTDKAFEACERFVKRAQELLARTREAIASAATAADSDQ